MGQQSSLVRLNEKYGLAWLHDLVAPNPHGMTCRSIVVRTKFLEKPPTYLGGVHPDWSQDRLYMWETNGCIHDMSDGNENTNWIPYDYYQYTRQNVRYVNQRAYNRLQIAFKR